MKSYPPLFSFVPLLMAISCASCTASRGPLVVTDPDPSVKIPAMAKAVRTHDLSAVPQLIKELDNDDAAVRFYAIHALRALTGQEFGFRAYQDENQREPAVSQWKQWLARRTETNDTNTTAAVE